MARLPSHFVVSGLLRAAEAGGGNGVVLSSGDRNSGAILIILTRRGRHAVVLERVSALAGGFTWNRLKTSESDEIGSVARLVDSKQRFDPDLWTVELDVADVEQFIVDSLG